MQYKLLVLMALCAFASALLKDKRPLGAESESDEFEDRNNVDTTTEKSESKIIAIYNATDLDTRIGQAGDKVVIIYFMVTWCPFCKEITPAVENISAKAENLIVLQVDRDNLEKGDENWKYGLSNLPSVPRFIFIKNGKKLEEISGSESDLWGTLSKVVSPTKHSSKSLKNSSQSSNDSSKSSEESSNSSDSSDEKQRN